VSHVVGGARPEGCAVHSRISDLLPLAFQLVAQHWEVEVQFRGYTAQRKKGNLVGVMWWVVHGPRAVH